MRSKILKTDPAPFKATATTLFITGHVHAAFVFSEGDLALGARLRVEFHPLFRGFFFVNLHFCLPLF